MTEVIEPGKPIYIIIETVTPGIYTYIPGVITQVNLSKSGIYYCYKAGGQQATAKAAFVKVEETEAVGEAVALTRQTLAAAIQSTEKDILSATDAAAKAAEASRQASAHERELRIKYAKLKERLSIYEQTLRGI